MNEQTINGKRVVFREHIPARAGWDLLKAVRRVDAARLRAVSESVGRQLTAIELASEGRAEDVTLALDQVDFMSVVLSELSYEEIEAFIRGAVVSWEFDGDPSKRGCCEALDTLTELLPLATSAILLFYTATNREKLTGEAGSGSTSALEA
jgi:hypothetical protein